MSPTIPALGSNLLIYPSSFFNSHILILLLKGFSLLCILILRSHVYYCMSYTYKTYIIWIMTRATSRRKSGSHRRRRDESARNSIDARHQSVTQHSWQQQKIMTKHVRTTEHWCGNSFHKTFRLQKTSTSTVASKGRGWCDLSRMNQQEHPYYFCKATELKTESINQPSSPVRKYSIFPAFDVCFVLHISRCRPYPFSTPENCHEYDSTLSDRRCDFSQPKDEESNTVKFASNRPPEVRRVLAICRWWCKRRRPFITTCYLPQPHPRRWLWCNVNPASNDSQTEDPPSHTSC